MLRHKAGQCGLRVRSDGSVSLQALRFLKIQADVALTWSGAAVQDLLSLPFFQQHRFGERLASSDVTHCVISFPVKIAHFFWPYLWPRNI